MITKIIAPMALIAGLALGPAHAMEPQQPAAQPQGQQQAAAPNVFDPNTWMQAYQGSGTTGTTGAFNPLDMSSWMNMGGAAVPGQGVPVQFNLANPAGWAVFMNPATYPAMMNPATYAQFMSPQWYMQFANPNNWMAWMNPAAYGPWMNPMTYMQWMNPAAYAIPGGSTAGATTGYNWFDPSAWMGAMTPQPQQQQ